MLSIARSNTIADEVLGAVSSDLATVEVHVCSAIWLGIFAANITAGTVADVLGLRHEQTAFEA